MPLFSREKGAREPEKAQQRGEAGEGGAGATARLPSGAKLLSEYAVGETKVAVFENGGRGFYWVFEPELSEEERRAYEAILSNLRYVTVEDTAEAFREHVDEVISRAAALAKVQVPPDLLEKLRYYVVRDQLGYGRIDVLMRDDDIEEISLTRPENPVYVIHRKFTEYYWLETNVRFSGEQEVRQFVVKLANKFGKSVSIAQPIVDVIAPDGSRLALVYGTEVAPGSHFDIRRFPKKPFTLGHLLNFNTLSPLMAAYLWLVIEVKGFPLVIGPMGSGKTTLVNSLITLIHPDMKICTCEDTPELRVPHRQWERLWSRPVYGSSGSSAVSLELFDLVKLSMRVRPDYVIVGEVRGREAQVLAQAAAMGCGSLTTFHASDAHAAVTRLTSPPLEVPVGGVQLIWCVVSINRVEWRGKIVRRVLDITELVRSPEAKFGVDFNPLFSWNPSTDAFTPDSAEEVVKRSARLREVAEVKGWGVRELVGELEERAALLRRLAEEGKVEFEEWSREIARYLAGEGRWG